MAEERRVARLLPAVATLLSIVWIGYSAFAFVTGHAGLGVATLPILVAAALVPPAFLFAVAAAFGAAGRAAPRAGADDPASDPARDPERITALLDGIATSRAALAADMKGLEAMLETLGLHGEALARTTQQLGAASVGLMESCQQLTPLVGDAGQALAMLDRGIGDAAGGVARDTAALRDAAQALGDEFARLDERGRKAEAALAQAAAAGREATAALRDESTGIAERLAATQEERMQALDASGARMLQQLQQGHQALEALAAQAATTIEARLKAVAADATAIEGALRADEAACQALVVASERAFQLLDARVQHSNETTGTALDRLGTRIEEVNQKLAGLSAPIRARREETAGLEQGVAALRETALQLIDILGKGMHEEANRAGSAIAGIESEIRTLGGQLEAAGARTQDLATSIAEQRQTIDRALCAVQENQQQTASATADFIHGIEQAQGLLADIDARLRDTTLSSAGALVDAIARARNVANEAAGATRALLDQLVDDAAARLSATAEETLAASFVAPLTEKIGEAQQLAAAATEQTARNMAALVPVLKQIEDQVKKRSTALEEARQTDLLASSSLLMDELANASVSIASALGQPMDDDDWEKWRKGERTLFQQRARRLLERKEAKELGQLVRANPELEGSARAYVAAFEALAERMERQAPGLANALRGTEQGRLAGALREVLER